MMGEFIKNVLPSFDGSFLLPLYGIIYEEVDIMKSENLKGKEFISKNGTEYLILCGFEGGEAVFEEKNNPYAPLHFCCDAQFTPRGFKGAYNVSYSVSKSQFFDSINEFDSRRRTNAETIACALKEKYYKIPMAFLMLVGKAYLNE